MTKGVTVRKEHLWMLSDKIANVAAAYGDYPATDGRVLTKKDGEEIGKQLWEVVSELRTLAEGR